MRTPEDPALGTAIPILGRGNFAKYPSWENGLLDWCKRLKGPKYAGAACSPWRPSYRSMRRRATVTLLMSYINAVKTAVAQWQKAPTNTYWVRITADALRVRQGPATTYPIAATLGHGTLVECDGTKNEGQGDWHHMKSGLGFFSGAYAVRV